MLNRISIGWHWLNDVLNRIIDEVNQQKPLQSTSIAVEESPNGTMLKVIPVQQQGSGQPSQHASGAGTGGTKWPANVGWRSLAVIDNSSGSCVTKYLWYWGTSPTGVQTPPPS